MTDANVVLGYIAPGPLASGALTVSRELAEEAVGALGAKLGLSTLETARGIHDLANAATMRALRAVSTEKGRDPADFALVAYGGSGPVHAAALAAELGTRTAIVPPLAGLFSAAGLLFARAEYHDVRFCRDQRARARPRRARAARRRDARARSRRASTASPSGAASPTSATAARAGASRSSCPASSTRPGSPALVERFEDEHERLYGTRLEPGSPVDIRALRLAALGPEREPFALPAGERDVERHAPRRLRPGARRARRAGRLARVARRRRRARPAARGRVRHDGRRPARLDGAPRRRRATRSCSSSSRSRPTPPRAHADAIAMRLVGNALETAADEMATAIFRTAHSAVVRDAMDYSAALCAASGETVAQAVTIPLQLGSIPNAMRTLLEHFGERFRPGDVFIVNDPFDGASHTPDIFIAKPSFARRDADRLRGVGRAPRRHRRPRAGLVRVRQHRRLPGGPAPAVDAALRGGRAQRGAVRHPARERARAARAARRPRGAGRRVPHRRPRAAGARRAARPGAARVADGRPARPHRAAAAPRDRELARRHRDVHRLPRLGRDRACATSR